MVLKTRGAPTRTVGLNAAISSIKPFTSYAVSALGCLKKTYTTPITNSDPGTQANKGNDHFEDVSKWKVRQMHVIGAHCNLLSNSRLVDHFKQVKYFSIAVRAAKTLV